MRRLLLVNALIFAVLAAAVALAYYGYSYTTEVSSRDRERELLYDLAEEKVISIESLIVGDDKKLFQSGLALEPFLAKLSDLARGVHLVSVFVLDAQLKVIPDGYKSVTRELKQANEFRDWFEASVVPNLGLDRVKENERGHLYFSAGEPYLFSFTKKRSGDRVYYIVIEEDLKHLVFNMFPQFFPFPSKRLYQVVDERGDHRYGPPFTYDTDRPTVTVPFVDTVDGWSVRVSEVSEASYKVRKELERKRLVDSMFIGGGQQEGV